MQFLSDHPELAIMIGLAVMVFVMVFLTLSTRYKRCPSNRVLVIYGKMTGSPTGTRCLHGGARLVLPLVQDYAYLSLEPIQIEIPLKGALSMENIRVNVPSVFTVAVGTDMQTMQQAAIRLLGLNTEQIKQQSSDIILGQLRQVIASMRIEDINRDREKFLHNIQNSLEPELAKIGLVLINVNITDITDESGYIEAIGRKAASQAVQQAKIDVSLQEKHGQIGVAEAEREKFIQVANATKLREIGTRKAQREQAVRLAQLEKEQKVGEQTAILEREAAIKESQRQQAVRIAELDREQKVGEQTAVLEREARIKDAERKMRIATADANAKAITGEASAQAEIAAAQANLQVKQAESYQLGETRKREVGGGGAGGAEPRPGEGRSGAGGTGRGGKRAAVEAPAKAEKARIIVEAEAEAEKRRIEAEGQAAAIFAKLDAEARGQFEILAKKGDGLRKIIDACGGCQQAFQLLMLEHLDGLAKTAAQAISNIKFDKVVVWEGGGNNGHANGTSSTTNFLQSMAHSMPPMMQIMKDIGGVETPRIHRQVHAARRKAARPSVNGTKKPPKSRMANDRGWGRTT